MATSDTSDGETARLLQTALAAQRQGRNDDAERSYARVLARAPEQPQALNALGMIALQRNQHAVAREWFARAAAADPAAPQLWINLATASRALGEDDGEETALRRALEIDQGQLMVHLRLAELYQRCDAPAPAAKHWSAVLALGRQIDPPPPELQGVLDRAQAFVSEQSASFAAAIDAGLAPSRAELADSTRRRFDAGIEALLGRRRLYQNQCAGLYFPFLPPDEYFERSHFGWMAELETQTDAIRAELEALLRDSAEAFEPYVAMDAGTPQNIWSKLDHSLDWSALHLFRHGRRNEAMAARCPRTMAALATVPQADLPRRSPTAFFSLLKPHTHIPPHGGVTNIRATVHLPLVVPPDCRFRVGGEMREWRVGEAWAFDDTIEHEAWNDSDDMRAVLIFDVWNPHLTEAERALLRTFFLTADASGHDPGMLGDE